MIFGALVVGLGCLVLGLSLLAQGVGHNDPGRVVVGAVLFSVGLLGAGIGGGSLYLVLSRALG